MENLTKSVNLGWSMSRMAALALLMGNVACGPMEEVASQPGESPSTQEQEAAGENGITVNGITVNGITVNGITVNGITVNGITVNGLATSEFSAWFNENVEQNSTLMRYIVKCAVAEGESRTYLDPLSGQSYTWQGSLGLTPGWASGQRINEAEQQLITACLVAHINKFGIHVPLSVLGRTSQQEPIPYSAEELQTFSRREACFFGNLFTQEGMFAGVDRDFLNEGESSPRACGLTTQQDVSISACSPLVHIQSCEAFCTLDASGLFYTECTYNGRTYLPLTTRIRTEDVYTCGDGVCQFTERCGEGNSASSCASDCGPCA